MQKAFQWRMEKCSDEDIIWGDAFSHNCSGKHLLHCKDDYNMLFTEYFLFELPFNVPQSFAWSC